MATTFMNTSNDDLFGFNNPHDTAPSDFLSLFASDVMDVPTVPTGPAAIPPPCDMTFFNTAVPTFVDEFPSSVSRSSSSSPQALPVTKIPLPVVPEVRAARVPDTTTGAGVFRAIPKREITARATGARAKAACATLKAQKKQPQHTVQKKARNKNSLANLTEEERIIRRRKKNREAAQLSRLRKRLRLESLEKQVADQKAISAKLASERDLVLRENLSLKHEVEYLKNMLRERMVGAGSLPSPGSVLLAC